MVLGHHLGSNGVDVPAKKILAPIAETIDRERLLERYRIVLHLLAKPSLDEGSQPWTDAALAILLRNELVHFKSKWGMKLQRKAWLKALQQKKHRQAPFLPGGMTFFPYSCLSAACAEWAVTSCVSFLDAFYANLGFPDRLRPYRARLLEPPARKRGTPRQTLRKSR